MFLVKKLTKKSDDKSSSKPSIPTPLPPRATPAPVNIPVETAPPVVDILESCKRGDLEVMESYLREQGDVERKNKLGTTLLMLASSYGKTEIVSLLLTHGANVNHQDKYRDTALTIACSSGHGEVVTLLLARGANIHHQDKEGNTPLHRTCIQGHHQIISLLLEAGAGASLSTLNNSGKTPAEVICTGRRAVHTIFECSSLLETFLQQQQQHREEEEQQSSPAAPPEAAAGTGDSDFSQQLSELRQAVIERDQEIAKLRERFAELEKEKNREISSLNDQLYVCRQMIVEAQSRQREASPPNRPEQQSNDL